MGAVKTNSLLNNPDPNAVRRRPVLSLPTPRVSDTELESISKLGKSRFANDFNLEGGEDTPGASLLGDYARTPHGASSQGATPARTPSVGGQEAILREAMHLRNLARGQTPLLGGENPSLVGSDFSGITPARRDAPTPNPNAAVATPHTGGGGGAGSFSATPLRDALHINDSGVFDDSGLGKRELKLRARSDVSELRSGLSSLPAPANEYRVEVPDVPSDDDDDDDDDAGDAMEEDLADVRAREVEAARALEEAALRRRSVVIRRDLPRPPADAKAPEFLSGGKTDSASRLVADELSLLLAHDAARYPVRSRSDKTSGASNVPHFPQVETHEMLAAAALVTAEARAVRHEMGHGDSGVDEYVAAFAAVRAESVVTADGSFMMKKSLNKEQRIALAQQEHDSLVLAMKESTKRSGKLERKVELLTTGLQKRAQALGARLGEVAKTLLVAREEHASYQRLHERELIAAPRRIEQLVELTGEARRRESELQRRFATRTAEATR